MALPGQLDIKVGPVDTGDLFTEGSTKNKNMKEDLTAAGLLNREGKAKDTTKKRTQTQAEKLEGQTPTDFSVDTTRQDKNAEVQAQLIAALQAQMAGEGPSLAQGQLKQGSDRALSQQLAMAAQARTPGQGALSQRLAARNAGEQQQQMAAQAAQIRLQEQLQAQQLLGGVAGQARGQDLGLAGLEQGSQQLGSQERTSTQGLINQLLGIEGNIDAGVASNLTQQQLASTSANQANQTSIRETNQRNDEAAARAAAAMFGMSDVNTKENIIDIPKEDLQEFWDAYNPVVFDYTKDFGGKKDIPGFVIQDIEHTKLGKGMVVDVDGIKHYDMQKFMGILGATFKHAMGSK